MHVPKTLLVPVDFSDTSEVALDYAFGLAHSLGARLVVMHAYELPIYGFPDGALVASADVAARVMQGAQVGLEGITARYRDRDVRLDTVLRHGVPWEEATAVAEEVGADLIVIGTHGRRGVARALLGSVAEKILRTSTLPVLTVHLPKDAQDQRTYKAPASSSIPAAPVAK